MKLDFFAIDDNTNDVIPLSENSVKAGFPSPAQGYLDQSIDLNKVLIKHKATTFCTRVSGDSMKDANINDGDYLIVDRSLEPHNGDMAVCFVDGEFTLKYIEIKDDGIWLKPANPNYPAFHVDEGCNFMVWGIVTYSIHKHI